DLAAEQRNASAVTLGLERQLECVSRRPLATAEHADDQAPGIIGRQLLHGLGPIVLQFQEERPVGRHDTSKAADDAVVDIMTYLGAREADIEARVEDFEKVSELASLGFGAERPIGHESLAVALDIVRKGYRVESEV